MVQNRAGLLRTAVGEVLRPREEIVLSAFIDRQTRTGYQELPLLGSIGETTNRSAAGHPPLVPRDEIESRSKFLGEQPRPACTSAQSVNAGLTGAAEVDEQRSDSALRIGRGQFDHCEVELLVAWPVVVQRD